MLPKRTKDRLIGMGIGYVVGAIIIWASVVEYGAVALWLIPWGLAVGALVLVAGWRYDKYLLYKHIDKR